MTQSLRQFVLTHVMVPLHSRLANRVALAVAIPVIAFILLAVSILYIVVTRGITEGSMENHRHDLVLRAERIGGSFGSIVDTMGALAHNTMIANGLIDSAGRETYLMPLLAGFNNVSGIPVNVRLVDFLAEDLADNGVVPEIESYRRWMKSAIDAGASAATMITISSVNYVLVADVIIYSRTHSGEGALVYLFPLSGSEVLTANHAYTIYAKSHSFADAAAHGKISDRISLAIPVPQVLSGLGLTISVIPDTEKIKGAIQSAAYLLVTGGVLALFAVIVIAYWIGRRLALPLQELAHTAGTVADDLWTALPPALPRQDEVGALDRAFREMLAKLRNIYRTLEDRVEERTCELKDAMIDVEEASRAKSDFLSSMSHELRTPLNAVLGFAQLIEMDRNLDDGHRASIQQILKSGRHLLDLVTQLLDLSRIESGSMAISMEDIDVLYLVDESVEMMMPVAAHMGVTLERVPFKCTPIYARGDITRLRQCLLNLISNAIKYNTSGGFVRVECELVDGREVRITVHDTGIGIPADKQGDVFETFSRLGQESSSIEGTGIGLILTRRILNMMNGEIFFTSEAGKGSSFWMVLPALHELSHPSHEKIATASFNMKKPLLHKRILYIEDNPTNLLLVKRILQQRREVDLISAHTADLGIAIAHSHKPDLILMDIHLPGKSGLDALAELRRNSETAEIPVIAVSAAAMPSFISHARKAGFDDYLTKPLQLEQFLITIDRFLFPLVGTAKLSSTVVIDGEQLSRNDF